MNAGVNGRALKVARIKAGLKQSQFSAQFKPPTSPIRPTYKQCQLSNFWFLSCITAWPRIYELSPAVQPIPLVRITLPE